MLTWGHNEAISMDATFGANDVTPLNFNGV
jgi:hypothetical protein